MALQRVKKTLLFAKGVEQRVTHELLQSDNLTILENCISNKAGSLSHKKGATALPTATTGTYFAPGMPNVVSPQHVNSIDGLPYCVGKNDVSVSLAMHAPQAIYNYDSSISKWSPSQGYGDLTVGATIDMKAGASSVVVETYDYNASIPNEYVSGNPPAIVSDFVYESGKLYIAQNQSTTMAFLELDPDTGVMISLLSYENLGATKFGRVISTSPGVPGFNRIHFVWSDTLANTIKAVSYDPATQTVSAPFTIITDLGGPFDITISTGGSIFIAYESNFLGTGLVVKRYTSFDPVTLANTYSSASTIGRSISIQTRISAPASVFVAWTDGNNRNINMQGFSNTLVSSWGPSLVVDTGVNDYAKVVMIGGKHTATAVMNVYCTVRNIATYGLDYYYSSVYGVDTGGVFTSLTMPLKSNMSILSRPVVIDGLDYFWMQATENLQGRYYLCTCRPLNGANACERLYVAGMALYGNTSQAQFAPWFPDVTATISVPLSIAGPDADGFYHVGATRLLNAPDDTLSNQIYMPIGLKFNPSDARKWQYDEAAGVVVYNGGQACQYDGEMYTQVGFSHTPIIQGAAATTGGSMLNGTYGFIAVFEYFDARGRRHLSAPSAVVSVVLSGLNNAISVPVVCTEWSRTNKSFNVLIYRTVSLGSTYYFDSRIKGDAPLVTATSVQPDSILTDNEILYTQSGELPNFAPYGVGYVCTFKDRVFAICDNALRYSKKVEEFDPIEFSEDLYITVESKGGRMVGLAALLDKLLIFKKNRIYVILGDGPNDTGTFGDFSPIQLINSTYGCVNPKSIVEFNNKVFFQSEKTLCVIDANLQVTPLEQLNYYFEQTPLIKEAKVIESENQIRWSDGSKTFVYFYDYDMFGVFATEGLDSIAVTNEGLFFVQNSVLKSQNDSAITNSDATIDTMRVATAWISFESVQDFQRVYSAFILGRKRGDHKLTIKVMYDFVPVVVETHTIDETATNVLTNSIEYADSQIYDGVAANTGGLDQNVPAYQYRIKLGRQKCQSVRFLIQDSDQESTGSVDLIGIAFELGVKAQVPKLWARGPRTV